MENLVPRILVVARVTTMASVSASPLYCACPSSSAMPSLAYRSFSGLRQSSFGACLVGSSRSLVLAKKSRAASGVWHGSSARKLIVVCAVSFVACHFFSLSFYDSPILFLSSLFCRVQQQQGRFIQSLFGVCDIEIVVKTQDHHGLLQMSVQIFFLILCACLST